MKKLLFISALAILTSIAYGQVTNGLVAKYSFNSGNANDEAGTNNGIVVNATLTTDRFGNPNKAYYFSKTDSSYIQIPHNAVNDFSNSSSFTVAFWVKFAHPYLTSLVISKNAPGYWNGYIFLANSSDAGYCNGPGKFFFYTASGAQEDACANDPIANDSTQWFFVVGAYDGTQNKSYIYINGVQQNDIGQASGTISIPSADIYLGRDPLNPYVDYFTGKIDDIRIYSRMLNQIEIDSLYNDPNPMTLGIYDVSTAQSFISIYPNPTHNNLNITINKSGVLQVYGLEGKLIETINITNNNHNLDVSNYSKGMYMLQFISNDGNTYQNKFIKE